MDLTKKEMLEWVQDSERTIEDLSKFCDRLKIPVPEGTGKNTIRGMIYDKVDATDLKTLITLLVKPQKSRVTTSNVDDLFQEPEVAGSETSVTTQMEIVPTTVVSPVTPASITQQLKELKGNPKRLAALIFVVMAVICAIIFIATMNIGFLFASAGSVFFAYLLY